MSSAGQNGAEYFEGSHLTDVSYLLLEHHEVEILDNVSSVAGVVVVILPVGLLQAYGQVPHLIISKFGDKVLPVVLVGKVHHGEKKAVSLRGLLKEGAVEGVGEEVLVEGCKGIELLTLSEEGGEITICTIECHLLGIPDLEIVDLELVPLSEIDRDGL